MLCGDAPGEEGLAFVSRYFEIGPGGHSSLERHQHAHAVMVVRGRGIVILEDRKVDLAPFDWVYVAPGELHQFRAVGSEALGFVCTVDRQRDRPVAATPEEIERLCRDPAMAKLVDPDRA